MSTPAPVLMFVQHREMMTVGRDSVSRLFAKSVCHQCRIGIRRPIGRHENVKVAENAHVRLGIIALYKTRAALEQHRFDVDGIECSDNARKSLELQLIASPIERQKCVHILANFARNGFVLQASRQRRRHEMKATHFDEQFPFAIVPSWRRLAPKKTSTKEAAHVGECIPSGHATTSAMSRMPSARESYERA